MKKQHLDPDLSLHCTGFQSERCCLWWYLASTPRGRISGTCCWWFGLLQPEFLWKKKWVRDDVNYRGRTDRRSWGWGLQPTHCSVCILYITGKILNTYSVCATRWRGLSTANNESTLHTHLLHSDLSFYCFLMPDCPVIISSDPFTCSVISRCNLFYNFA